LPIVQNIARKQGTINQAPFKKKISSAVFGPRGNAGANVGDVTNPGNPAAYTMAGVDYNSGISTTGGAKNPVGNHSNTATQLDMPALVPNDTTTLVLQHEAVDVQPNERGKFFQPQSSKSNPMRVSGGVDPNSNTPFHPKMMAKSTRQRRYPNKAGERTKAASFNTQHTLAGASTNAGAGSTFIGASRWGTVKRGAAEAPIIHGGTLASPSSGGMAVASGTTGITSTGHRGKAKVTVNNNAHPFGQGYPGWIPNKRGVQPNEKGNTNPIQLGCKSGCR
jgi:hypothetical protein